MPVWLPALVLLAPGAPGFEELCLTGPEGAAAGPLGGRTLACLAYGDPYEYGLPFELPFLVLPDLGARPCYAIVDQARPGLLCRALWSVVGVEHKVLTGQVSVSDPYLPEVLDPDLPEVMGAGPAVGEFLLATPCLRAVRPVCIVWSLAAVWRCPVPLGRVEGELLCGGVLVRGRRLGLVRSAGALGGGLVMAP